MAELFGFSIQRASKDVGPREKTFTDPTPDDGAIEVAGGGFFSSVLDTDGRERSDLDLIRRYRDISMQSECDAASPRARDEKGESQTGANGRGD